jgi:hypothetical protein
VRLRRLYLRGAAALAGVAALLAIAEVLGGSFDSTDAKIFGTIATAFVGGSAVVAGLACVERGSRRLGWAAVAVSATGFALWVEEIWAGHSDEPYWKVLGLFLTWTLVLLVATTNTLMTRRRSWLYAATLACATGAGLVASVMILAASGDGWQLFAVLLILTLLGQILTPILERAAAAGERPAERELGSLDGVTVVAVRGGGRRVVRIGEVEAPLGSDESVVLRRS